MNKIMIYCQHLAGMGHLVRCREIMRSLVKNFKVCFVTGGQMVPQFQLPNEVEIVYLPALWQKGSALVPLEGTQSLEAVKAERQQILINTFDRFQPDCLVTECFPFSKMSMKSELTPLLKKAKASAQPVKIVCSLRDIIMTQPLSPGARQRREEKVCRLINRFYDAVLFHSDPSFIKLEEFFPRVGDLTCEIIYTGYVAQSPFQAQLPTPDDIAALSAKTPMIVASTGGGRHGFELLNAVIAASPQLAETIPHQIYAFAGPFMPEEDFLKLQQAAIHRPNVTLRRYTSLLLDYFKQADLSVSLGGYNTTMNLLRTKVRSLLLPSLNPSQADEQRIRAEKLARMDVLTLLTAEDLQPERLGRAMITALCRIPAAHTINLQGADNTAHYFQTLLQAPEIIPELTPALPKVV